MLESELRLANDAFSKQRFKLALAHYENFFPSKVSELAGMLSESQVLTHIYRNYLFCLKALGRNEQLTRFLYEYPAYSPLDTILRKTNGLLAHNQCGRSDDALLSIIVPVYNSGKYLDHCIQSIRTQSYKNFELILVNDGSTDDSADIISRHAVEDSRIVTITNEVASGNPGTPRNQALAIATGEYVGFVDSDDWINSDFYKTLMTLAMDSSADIAFSGGFYNHMSDGRVSQRTYTTVGFDDPTSPRFKTHDSFMIWDKVFKRSLLEMFNIRLGETKAAVDVPFIFSAYYYASNIVFDDNLVGYNYRRETESSVTVAHRKSSNCEFEFQAFEAVKDWATQQDIGQYYYSIIDIKLVSSLMYTLKIVNDIYFDSVFARVKTLFESVNSNDLKQYCKASRKWWQFREFQVVLEKSAIEVKRFLEEKKRVAEEKAFAKLIEPRFKMSGENPGVLFFPCWMVNNPYQKMFYESLYDEYGLSIEGDAPKALSTALIDKKKGEFKYIHLHWLHNFFDFEDDTVIEDTITSLSYAKENGFEIIYTAHNISSHDSKDSVKEKLNRSRILDLVDHSIVHGNFAKSLLVEEFSVDPQSTHIVPHGTYGNFYGTMPAKEMAREQFNIPDSATVFLFFGNIKGYKGIFNLLSAFNKLRAERDDVYLIIAGRVLDEDIMPKLVSECDDRNIVFRPGFIQNEEVATYFACADLCVLPYEAVLTSGAAMLSLSLRCPVLAPSIGVLPEIVTDNIGMLFKDFEEMELKLSLFADGKSPIFDASNFDEFLHSYSWPNVVKNLPFLRVPAPLNYVKKSI